MAQNVHLSPQNSSSVFFLPKLRHIHVFALQCVSLSRSTLHWLTAARLPFPPLASQRSSLRTPLLRSVFDTLRIFSASDLHRYPPALRAASVPRLRGILGAPTSCASQRPHVHSLLLGISFVPPFTRHVSLHLWSSAAV